MINFDAHFRKAKLWLQLCLGLHAQARDTLEEMLLHNPRDAHALASRAHLKAMAKDLQGALEDYQKLTASGLANAANWFNQGFLFEQANRLEEAEKSLRQAVAMDDGLDRAWYGLGLVLVQLNQIDEAIAALRRNTQLQPMSPHAWYHLARVHMDRQEPDETAKIIRHLKGFEPKVAARLELETGIKVT